jgi:hypothetical protein
VASTAPKAIHGAATITSIPVIFSAQAASADTISALGGHVGLVKLSW